MSNIEEILKRLMSHFDAETYVKLAEKIQVKESTIYQWKQRGDIPKRTLYHIAYKENISQDWLEKGEGVKETSEAAIHTIAPILGHHLPELTPSVKIYTADSLRMFSTIYITDKLFVDESKTKVISKRIYMLRGDDYTIFPARLFITDKGVKVKYDNDDFKEEMLHHEILGLVTHIVREV